MNSPGEDFFVFCRIHLRRWCGASLGFLPGIEVLERRDDRHAQSDFLVIQIKKKCLGVKRFQYWPPLSKQILFIQISQ